MRAETTRRVRVMISPDMFVGFPVEVVVDGKAGYVDASMLGISASLAHDLEALQAWWELHTSDGDEVPGAGDEAEWADWGRQGTLLVERLQAELGEDFYVTWS